MHRTASLWAVLALVLAGCGGGGDSTSSSAVIAQAPVQVDPVAVPTEAPAPAALTEAEQNQFQQDQFNNEITAPQAPAIEQQPSADTNTTAPDFFAGFQGGGEIPGAARGALTGDSYFPAAAADAFPDTATFGLFGVQFVSPTQIRGNLQFADSGSHPASVPVTFSETGLTYPNRLVYEAGGSLSLESRVITYYRSGYRNDTFHERSWWAVISGEATVNGVANHTFAIFLEDRHNADDPNDTRMGKDYFSITVYSPNMPYGGAFERDGQAVWGLQGVVYHNQYPLRAGDIKALDTPPEPTTTTSPVDPGLTTP